MNAKQRRKANRKEATSQVEIFSVFVPTGIFYKLKTRPNEVREEMRRIVVRRINIQGRMFQHKLTITTRGTDVVGTLTMFNIVDDKEVVYNRESFYLAKEWERTSQFDECVKRLEQCGLKNAGIALVSAMYDAPPPPPGA